MMDTPVGATTLDPDEMEGLKFPHVETRAELDQLEQQNIQDGLRWLSRQRKFEELLNEQFLLELHKKLFGAVWDWVGQYRRTGKNIGIDPIYIGVEIRNLLDDVRYWIEHQTYAREDFAARLHHRLVKIHPFENGNGRHARIFTDAVLENELGLKPINWSADESVDDETHRQNYLKALRSADHGDYQLMIDFVSRK
jgi:Fic-DOC domain mobile mystery protein B